jgi:hypothetical protein
MKTIASGAVLASLLVLAALSTSGCASGGGLFQPPKASGVVQADEVGGPILLPATTSLTNPLVVHNGFAVKLHEDNYSATFNAHIVAYTAATTSPCYAVAMDSTGTLATFTPQNSTAVDSSAGSPCLNLGTDIETVSFTDQQNHALLVVYENEP